MKSIPLIALLAVSITGIAFAQEPRQPNFSKRVQALEAQLGTSSELGSLTAGCAIESDSTPIPDACVGDGVDGGGGGGVDTANSPNANEYARFTDADTIEGRTASEVKSDLDLEVGTDLQGFDADLSTWGGLTPSAFFQTIVDDANGAAVLATIGGLAASSYTAADVLSKLLTVDGTGSGVDADLLDGNSSAAFQGVDADLTSWAAITRASGFDTFTATPSAANLATLVTGESYGLTDSELSAIAGLTSAADRLPYFDGSGTAALATFTAAGRALIDDADAAAQLTTLGAAPLASPTFTGTVTLPSGAVGSTAAANDSDTSVATTAFVQQEIDDGDLLSDNCVLENDATPIPDSCVGNGTDDGGGGGAPTTVDYLVGTADGTLSNEIVVGATPGGELGNTWASPTLDDSVSVTDWTLTSPNIAAGSATASSWPNFTSGTLLTSAEDGALELDANALYFTTDAGNRGYVPVRHIVRADSARNLTNDTNENPIFDAANDRLTLETGTYKFEALLMVTSMSGTSGNALFDWLGAGTATIGTWLWTAYGADVTGVGEQAARMAQRTAQDSAASIFNAATNTALIVDAKGTFEVTGAGTLIPSIDLVTASAAILSAGSYFMVERIGADTLTAIGQWD